MTKIEYIKARKLITKPRKWNNSRYAIDCYGMICLAHDPNAIKWCALSACNKYTKSILRTELKLAAMQLGFTSIVNLNDTGTHAQVLQMFDLAILMCN